MIELITGLPGGGKTLLLVADLKRNAEQPSPRSTFVCGVPGLSHQLLWTPLPDPTTWHLDAPEGSLIVIDECQHWFPPRPSGSKVPDFVSAFETHRHRGLDFILITQHPKLIDQNLRRLIERHRHVTRVFGSQLQNVYEWNTCNESPEPPQTLKNANCKKQRFDKSLFGLYKSATQHTHKARLPWKKIGIGVGAITLCLGLVTKFLIDMTAQASPQLVTVPPVTKQVTDGAHTLPEGHETRHESVSDRVGYIVTGRFTTPDYEYYIVEGPMGTFSTREVYEARQIYGELQIRLYRDSEPISATIPQGLIF